MAPSPRSSTAASLRGVLFDYGGVLTTPTRLSIADWVAREGLDPHSFSAVLKAWLSRGAPAGNPLHRLEDGSLSREGFNEELTARLRTLDGAPVEPADHLGGIFATMSLDPDMLALLHDLRGCGVRLGLLSNSWGNTYPPEVLALFDAVVISGEEGLRKPQPEAFALALSRLGLAAEEVLFVDDGAPNIEAAQALGVQTLLHVDAATTTRTVRDRVGLTSPAQRGDQGEHPGWAERSDEPGGGQ